MQSSAAGKAAGGAQRNLQMILPQMQQNYNTAVAGYQPFATAGQLSLTDQQDLLGLNGPDAASAAMAKFQTSPGYQWSVQQALRGVDAGAASQGMLRSGATIKAEQDRAAQLANQEFGNYYNRLGALSTLGFNAAGGIANAGQNLVANEEGNAQSQNTALIGGANAQNSILGNAASGLGNTVNSLFSNPNFQQWLGIGNTPAVNTTFSGYAPSLNPGQGYVGGFVAPQQSTQGY